MIQYLTKMSKSQISFTDEKKKKKEGRKKRKERNVAHIEYLSIKPPQS